MPQTATIKSLPAAFRMMKAMQAEGVEWGEDYRQGAREAVAELLRGRMDQLIDEHLERMAELGQADRRNGCYRRHLLTELGDIELHVPRTRTFSALKVVRAYARRAKDVDRMILACFVLGLSTRKVAIALLPVLGRPVSPATVSAVARQLDAAVVAFHRRPLKDIYRVLVLDGVVLRRKTGAGALARPVLVALGLRPDGKRKSSTSAWPAPRAPRNGSSSWATWCAAALRASAWKCCASTAAPACSPPCQQPSPTFPCSAVGRTRSATS